LLVPGWPVRYGSNFCAWTCRPRALSRRPSAPATLPRPSADTTPPVTKTYLVGAFELTRGPVGRAGRARACARSTRRATFALRGRGGLQGRRAQANALVP